MHIPDGFLDTKTWLGMTLISGGILAAVLRKLKHADIVKRIPIIGMTAAVVFAAQMLNFPVAGGTSGHFIWHIYRVSGRFLPLRFLSLIGLGGSHSTGRICPCFLDQFDAGGHIYRTAVIFFGHD